MEKNSHGLNFWNTKQEKKGVGMSYMEESPKCTVVDQRNDNRGSHQIDQQCMSDLMWLLPLEHFPLFQEPSQPCHGTVL